MAKREVQISIKVNDENGEAVVNRWKARFKELEDISDQAVKSVNKVFSGEISGAFASGGNKEYLESIRRLQPELKQLHQNLKDGAIDYADYQRRLQLLSPITQKAIQDAESLGKSFQDTGEAAEHGTNGLGKLLVSLNLLERGVDFVKGKLGEAKDEFLLFGKEMSEISTIVDDGFDLSKARREIASLPAALGKSSELAAGFKLAVGSGIEAGNALQFTADSAKAAKGGFAEVYNVVDASTTILNSYGIAAKNVNSVYDMMFETVKSGKIEFNELSQSVGQVTNIAAQSGVKLEEMFAVIATATATTKPATAIEAFRSALSNILKPSQEARDLAESLGLQFDVAALRSKGFAGFLQEVMDKTAGNTDKLAVLFGDVQGLNSILSITGAQAQNFAKNLGAMENATGNVDKAFQKSQESLNAQIEILGTAFEKRIGAALAFVEPLLMLILTTINKYPNAFTAGAIAVGALAAAHLLLNTQLIITASTAIPNLIKGIANTIAIMTSWTQVSTMSATALTAFTVGWGLVAVAIGVAGYALYNYVQSQKQTVEQQLQGIEAAKNQVDALNNQKQLLTELGGNVGDLSTRQQKLTEIYSTLSTASLDRVNSATKEKGAIGALAEEIERLNRAKGLELEVKTIALVDRTAKAYEAQRIAVNLSEAATRDYENSIGKLTPVMEVNAKTGMETGRVAMTVKDQFDQLGKKQTETAESANKAKEEYNNLKTALDAAARLMGVSTEQFIQAKVATGQLTQQNADFLRSLSGAGDIQRGFTNELNNGANAAKKAASETDRLAESIANLKKQATARSGMISDAVLEASAYAKNAAEAKANYKKLLETRPDLKAAYEDERRININKAGIEKDYSTSAPSAASSRSKSPNPEADFRRENRVKTGNAQWDKFVYEAAARQGVDPDLIFAQMQQESSFKANARSNKNAGGLMQVIPGTYDRMQRQLAKQGVKISDNRFDPRSSIEAGVAYMRLLLDQFGGNTALALAGYNAGEGAVMKYGNAIPPYRETQDYVKRISANYQKLKGGRAELGSNFDYARSLEDISDTRTTEQRNAETKALIDAARQTRMMPDASVISDYNKILVEQAKKAGGLQPTLEKTQEEFKNYYLPAKPSEAAPRELTLRDADPRADRFQNLSKSLGLMADPGERNRAQQLEERRLYLADEILIRQEDYRQSLEESKTDLEVEYRLLSQRNLELEATVEFSKQQNEQYRELQDIEVQLDVLRRASADENFSSERRLLSAKREELGLRQQIVDAEDALVNSGVNDSLKIQLATLEKIAEVRGRETEAIIRTNNAQIELNERNKISINQIRANLYEHLASQKTLNEAVSDGLISAYDKATDWLDKRLGKIGEIPILGDLARFGNRQFMTSLTTNLLERFLPADLVNQFKKTGNPVVDAIQDSNAYLKRIADSVAPTNSLNNLVAGKGFGGFGNGSSDNFWLNNLPNLISGGNSNVFGSGAQRGGLIFSHNEGGGMPVVPEGVAGNTSILSRIFGNGGIFGKDGFGNNTGTFGAFGAGANILGGLIGGRFGGALSGAGSGLAIGAQIGSIIPGVGTAIGAVAGAAIGFFTGLFGNKQRKQDEATRNDLMLQTLKQLNDIKAQMEDRRANIDVKSLVSNAGSIKDNYFSVANTLKDKKTREIAVKDGNERVTPLYNQIVAASEAAKLRQEIRDAAAARNNQVVAEFADGVYMDSGFRNQYNDFKRYNGMMPGSYTGKDYIPALIGDGEMVLNARQIAAVRARAGADVFAGLVPNYTPQPQNNSLPKFSTGANLSVPNFSSAPASSGDTYIFNVDATGSTLSGDEIEERFWKVVDSSEFKTKLNKRIEDQYSRDKLKFRRKN